MRIAIYSRKSKFTGKGESIGNQIEMCRDYIATNYNGEEHSIQGFEDEGFSGFKVRAEIIKSRVSAAGKFVNLVYDKNIGVDMVRSTVDFAKDMGLVSGNKNGYYFISDKDQKFTLKDMPDDFRHNPALYKIMKDNVIPILETNLSGITPEEMEIPDEEENFYSL